LNSGFLSWNLCWNWIGLKCGFRFLECMEDSGIDLKT